jgi:hypothetical protein
MRQKLTNQQADLISQHGEPVDGLLDRVEWALRNTKQTGLAEQFSRLICDINLEQEPTFEPNPSRRPPPPGPATAALWDAYTPVTVARVANVFTTVLNSPALEPSLHHEFAALHTDLALPTRKPAPRHSGVPTP